MKQFRLMLVAGLTIAILFAITFAIYFLYNRTNNPAVINGAVNSNTAPANQMRTPAPQSDNPFLIGMNSPGQVSETPAVHALDILLRLFVSVVLAAILAFRPRKNAP